MAFTFNGAQANVTLTTADTVGVPTPSTTQTVITKEATVNTNTITILHEATAGKTFYLTAIYVVPVGVEQRLDVDFSNDGVYFWAGRCGSVVGETTNPFYQIIFPTPVPILSGKRLRVSSSNTTVDGAKINIIGFEQ